MLIRPCVEYVRTTYIVFPRLQLFYKHINIRSCSRIFFLIFKLFAFRDLKLERKHTLIQFNCVLIFAVHFFFRRYVTWYALEYMFFFFLIFYQFRHTYVNTTVLWPKNGRGRNLDNMPPRKFLWILLLVKKIISCRS